MWVCFWTAAFPDVDFVLRIFDSLTYLAAHRGVTHSIILLPLWAIGLALLFRLITRRRYSWKAFVVPCALGIGAHIAGDVITSFGTMIFAPFSNWRVQFPTTFIIDLTFSGIIVTGLVASAIWKQERWPAVASLAVLVGFVGFQRMQHNRAVDVGNDYIAAQKLEAARAHAIPQPFSPFNWMVVVQTPREYRLAYVNLERDRVLTAPDDAGWLFRLNTLYRPVTDASWQRVVRYGEADPSLAQAAWEAPGLARYRDFAMFPAVLKMERNETSTCVWFDDLRFKMDGRASPFRYGGCRQAGSDTWATYRLDSDGNREIRETIPN
jgi:inner membrane protein